MSTRAATVVVLSIVTGAAACADDGVAPDTARSLDVAAGPVAQVQDGTADLRGDWTGLVTFVDGDDPEGNASALAITGQDGRRLVGTKRIGDADIQVAGAIAESGNLNMVGEGVGTSPGATQLRYKLDVFGGGAATLVGGVQHKHDGGVVRGGQVLLRQFAFDPAADPDPPAVSGEWAGDFTSDMGEASLGDRQLVLEAPADGPPTRVRGTITFREDYTPIPVEGSIDPDGSIVMVALAVGIIPCYVVVIEGTLIPGEEPEPCGDDVCPDPGPGEPDRIVGTYLVLCVVSPNMAISPNMVVEDRGTFEIGGL